MNINVNRNTNINNHIDRSKYQNRVTNGPGGRGEWQHDPEHRKGVAYGDQGTAQRFDRGASRDAQAREDFRGRAEAGRQNLARGGADQFRDRATGDRQGGLGGKDLGSLERGGDPQGSDMSSFDRGSRQSSMDRSAFGRYERGGQTRDFSSRGRESLSSSRSLGGGGGFGHSGGGFGGRRR